MKKTVPYINNLKGNRVISMMTAYDYPTAKAVSEAEIDIILVALESFGIVKYSSGLKEKIDSGILVDRDSIEEIEIRSTSIYVTAKLTELINNYKNEEEKIIIPQLDFKLWTDFHADERPHHLTKTIMY